MDKAWYDNQNMYNEAILKQITDLTSLAVQTRKRVEALEANTDRLQKIKHRLSDEGNGYDFTKDVQVTELFEDLQWLIDSLEREVHK